MKSSLQFEGLRASSDGYSSGFGVIAEPDTSLTDITGEALVQGPLGIGKEYPAWHLCPCSDEKSSGFDFLMLQEIALKTRSSIIANKQWLIMASI